MEIIVPVTVAFVVLYGMIKKVKIFDAFIEGAVEGLHTLYMIIPTITGLVVAVEMLQQSGTIDLVCKAVEPLAGATALLTNIYENYGPDSLVGNIASVLAGSTETTLYAVTMYFGSVGITKTRHTLFVGLLADFTALVLAIMTVKLTL